MNEIIELENELVNKIEGLREDIEATQQPRSNFALEHFVVGMHDTPGRQRMQAVLELQIKMFNIKRTQLEERKIGVLIRQQEKIKEDNTGGSVESELAEIEIERLQTDLAEMRLARMGNIREAKCLLAIVERLPKYTYEELQAEEWKYWPARLSRQALQDMKSIGTIGQGNSEAIAQMFRILGEMGHSLPADQLQAIAMITAGQQNTTLSSDK